MKRIPKYKSLRILLVSATFYFFLVMPFMGFIFIQKIPEYIDMGLITPGRNEAQVGLLKIEADSLVIPGQSDSLLKDEKTAALIPVQNPLLAFPDNDFRNQTAFSEELEGRPEVNNSITNEFMRGFQAGSNLQRNEGLRFTDENRTKYFPISFDIFFYGIEIILVITLIISFPFKRYFRRKRKGKEASARLEFILRRYLLFTPTIHAILFGLVMLATVGYIAYVNFFEDFSNSINAGIFDEYLYISAISGFLSTIFVFYWHKHRVHIFYLEVLYKEEELRKRIFNKNIGRIRNRLWLASGMTTLLPLVIVIFYLVLSVSKVSDLDLDLTNDTIKTILVGNYSSIFETEDLNDFFYVNSVNALMMFIGIGTSIFVSLIYILTFVRWTTLDIVFPVKELLGNMQKTGEGKNTNFSVVRTNDEIGELAEGFNIMSQRIKNYIDNINEINNSYYRFVPKQFLDFLDKKSITDIHLGDQVQKEMTVMFSDIRAFTEISEKMSPRDNFNFINHYLGYMEPIISRNHGFIDKYIGDAIMALFPESPDDAINAAIEMRMKLFEFNEDLRSQGKQAIDSGIGINTGNLMLGIVGGSGRIEGTVISDHVNLTSRLEGLTKKYNTPIIISQETLIKLENPQNYKFRFLDAVTVKGKRNSVNIFEILDGEKPQIKKMKIATNNTYKKALQEYQNRNFEEALQTFNDIKKDSDQDKVIDIYISRCQFFIKNGIPDDWNGVENLDEK
jgi:class 3 adenylate cyclase